MNLHDCYGEDVGVSVVLDGLDEEIWFLGDGVGLEGGEVEVVVSETIFFPENDSCG